MVDKSNYRVIRKKSYDEYHGNVTMQFLERKVSEGFLGSGDVWEIIDCEVVDENYLLSHGTTGFCAKGWESKFIEYIPRSRGGLLDG